MAKVFRCIPGIAFLVALLMPLEVFAHESYVLTKEQWQESLSSQNLRAFDALANPANLQTFLVISLCVLAILIVNFFFQKTALATTLSRNLERLRPLALLALRLALGASFFFSALNGNFLGPELPLALLPLAPTLRIGLFIVSGLLLVGLFTEFAAAITLLLFSLTAYEYGWYLITYTDYVGVIIALLLFGSGPYSLDNLLFGMSRIFASLKKYQTPIIRVSYGLALAWAAISVKLLHPQLTVTVIQNYHLNNYWVLFPHDPLLITLGVGMAELLIGLFIMVGFELRFTILVSLFYMTLSLLYFRELVWPHLILYGISLMLLTSPALLSIDSFFTMRHQRRRKKI